MDTPYTTMLHTGACPLKVGSIKSTDHQRLLSNGFFIPNPEAWGRPRYRTPATQPHPLCDRDDPADTLGFWTVVRELDNTTDEHTSSSSWTNKKARARFSFSCLYVVA
jgi:hypothetical protein